MTPSTRPSLAAVLIEPGNVELEERSVLEPGPGQVLLEVRSVGVCGSDVHYFREGKIGDYVVTFPLVLGHEASGVITATGPGVDPLRVGERVAIEPGVPCRSCRACRTGHYNLCKDVRFLATPPVDGAFCRYLLHDAHFVHTLPETLSDDAGALMEPLSVGVWANWKAGTRAGDKVVVTGGGAIGLLAAAVARATGAVRVVVSDPVTHRRDAARGFGATTVVHPGDLAEFSDFDVLLECSGNASAVDAGIQALGAAGRAVLVGMGPEPVHAVPVQVVQNREILLTGTFRYANTYPAAIELASSGAVNVEALVTAHFGLAATEQALQADEQPGTIKAIVRPPE